MLLIAVFAGFILFPEEVKQIFLWLEKVSAGLWIYNLPLITIISAIESFPVVGVIVPWQQLLLIVGGLYGQTHFLPAVVAAGIGACIWNALGYYFWIKWWISLLEKYGNAFSLGKAERDILEPQIQKNGAAFIILGKFHNFTRAFVPFLAWSLGMKGKNFWKYNIFGSLLWAGIILTIWVYFTRYIDIILGSIGYVFLGSFTLLAAYIYFFKRESFRKYLDQKTKDLS